MTTPLCRLLPDGRWDRTAPHDFEAMRLCLSCPLVRECAETAAGAATSAEHDACVFGATTPHQRENIRRGLTTLEGVWARNARGVANHDEAVWGRLCDGVMGGAWDGWFSEGVAA